MTLAGASADAGDLPPAIGNQPVSCPSCDLRSANLTGADLTGANLGGANLGGAALVAANLTDADLREAIFTGTTNLTAANLTNAKWSHPAFAGAILAYARSSGTALFVPKPVTTATARYYCGSKDATALPNVIYVSADGTDSASCGRALTSQCATIQRGIANCSGVDCAVLVAYGDYQLRTSLQLAGAVSVYGGCLMLDSPDPKNFSLLRGPEGAPAVIATRVVAPTIFQAFSIIAGNGRAAAGATASIAFASYVSSGMSLQAVDLTAFAGSPAAAEGRRGATPPEGQSGNGPIPGRGGNGKADGGEGGSGGRPGRDGAPGDTRRPPARGATTGRGEDGFAGRCGDGGKASTNVAGYITSDFAWNPSAGGAGQNGGYGGGGGGGGGGLASHGGGGGAGGEGGGGGEGGVQGGASIGLLIVGGELVYNGGSIHAGAGAAGRAGGGGGLLGASGGAGGARGGQVAGNGGRGGMGSPGSGGAGGNGGPSLAVATAGSDSAGEGKLVATGLKFYGGAGGAGGDRGDGGNPGAPCTFGEAGRKGIEATNQRLELREGSK
jgi:uncharacterized protein YjbI with pentapeptide repeats